MPDWGSASTWENGAQGAAGGALAGSAFGPIGAGIGGVLGGAAGLFGSQGASGMDSRLKALEQFYATRRAPQMQGANSDRRQQLWLLSQLKAMSQGRGPSLAREMLREGQDTGERRAQGMAASGAGPNAALAQYQAQQGAAMNQAQSSQTAAAMRQKEQMDSLQQFEQAAYGLRGQDLSVNQANLEAKLRTMGINDSGQLQAIMAQLGSAGPSMGQQLLAGGAGAGSFMASQRAQGRSGQRGSSDYANQDQGPSLDGLMGWDQGSGSGGYQDPNYGMGW